MKVQEIYKILKTGNSQKEGKKYPTKLRHVEEIMPDL